MSTQSNPTLVALSRQQIPERLAFELKDRALQFGVALHSVSGQETNGTYHQERWSSNQPLDIKLRESLRAIASNYQSDLCFIKSDLIPSDIRVLAMDMDSTLINIECIDEIADFTGKKSAVAQITEATMRGEIKDFKESLRRRVTLLEGIHTDALEAVYRERLRPNPGATELLAGANQRGIYTLLVSGGFTFFTEKLREHLGFKQTQANTLKSSMANLLARYWGHCGWGSKSRAFR